MAKKVVKAVIREGNGQGGIDEYVFTPDNYNELYLEAAIHDFMFDALFHYKGTAFGPELSLSLYLENDRLFTTYHQPLLEPDRFPTDWEILLEREERLAKCELEMWLSGSITANELTSGIYDFHGVIPSWIDTTLQGS